MPTHPTARLATAFAYDTRPRALHLLSQMNRCGGSEWNYQYTCRTAGCAECRSRYTGQQVRAATARYKHLANHDLSFVTVVIGATTTVEDVGEILSKFRKDLRNLVDANRRARRRWRTLDAMVWLETDAVNGADYLFLGSDKQKQFGELAPMFVMKEGPVWIVTVHGVFAHPGIDRQEVDAELVRRWEGHKRVDVRGFDQQNTVAVNLRRTINYSLKHECRSHIGATSQTWPTHWVSDYYGFLNEWSRGFQSTRITIRSVKDKLKPYPDSSTISETSSTEPMPFVYSNSIFDTYYN